MAGATDGLRKVLALERTKSFSDTAVIGGLDAYLRRLLQENAEVASHRFSAVLRALPPGGYRALHPVQRQRVVRELLRAMEEGLAGDALEGPHGPLSDNARAPAAQRLPPGPHRRASREAVIGTLDSPVTVLKGVSRATEAKLAKVRAGLRTVRDLLYLFPTRYDEYLGVRPINRLVPDKLQTVIGEVWSAGAGVVGRRKKVTEAVISDSTGSLRVIWWSGPWMARRVKEGMRLALRGKVTAFRGRLQMENPELDDPHNGSLQARKLLPVYPSTEGLHQRDIRRLLRQAMDAFAGTLPENLPEQLCRRLGLPPAAEALPQVHFPDSLERADGATRRFAFEELLYIELGVVRRRREWQQAGGAPVLSMPASALDGFITSLPFQLTNAQNKAIREVLSDIAREVPMSRLLEGDVGSGKTVVAAAALLAAVTSGYQGAIMAPTEILAEQHFQTFIRLLEPQAAPEGVEGIWFQEGGRGSLALRPPYTEQVVRVAPLTGSLKQSEKSAAQEAIARGDVDIAIGTHALVQEAMAFDRLGLAVVDEQHRFGVVQRAALREKGRSPHVLVMTATPIPRTLALTVYGDLDITVLDEMPPGRPAVKTYLVSPQQRARAYEFVQKKVAEGRQAYVICPLIEESEAVASRAAVQEYERLSREVFPELRLGLLHGRMTPAEKDATMRAFRDGGLDVLVSTAVVEVGIDIPNSTVMLIEGAERFGLSQLHQLRGRVRRSTEQAHCFLLAGSVSPEARERLLIMVEVDDGFKLAEEDLRLRGPGEYFGTRQSGLPDLRVAKLTDVDLIEQARREATRLLDDDPELARPEHAGLRSEVEKLWSRLSAEVS